jgi:hypothetical protein
MRKGPSRIFPDADISKRSDSGWWRTRLPRATHSSLFLIHEKICCRKRYWDILELHPSQSNLAEQYRHEPNPTAPFSSLKEQYPRFHSHCQGNFQIDNLQHVVGSTENTQGPISIRTGSRERNEQPYRGLKYYHRS